MRGVVAVGLLLLLVLGACQTSRVALAPEVVRGNPKPASVDPFAGIDPSLSPEDLFERGVDDYNGGRHDAALRYFDALIARYPEAPQVSDAAYNAGLILQRRNRHEEALTRFRRVVERAAAPRDRLDARFRMLACLDVLERFDDSLALIAEIRRRHASVSEEDRLELAAREGVARFHLGETATAEDLLQQTFHDYQIGLRRGDVVNEVPGALAAYTLGLIGRARFDELPIPYAEKETMLAHLNTKAQALLAAQDWFLRAIEQDNATFSTASGYQIAQLYRDFNLSIQAVELPPEFAPDSDEARMYRCMLAEQVRPLLRKAMRLFDRTVEMGERLRVRNRWTEQSRNELDAVEKLYLEQIRACRDVLPEKSSEPDNR